MWRSNGPLLSTSSLSELLLLAAVISIAKSTLKKFNPNCNLYVGALLAGIMAIFLATALHNQ